MKKHRLDRRERKKKKKIIVFSMIGIVCLLSVGYSAFSSNFLISGKGTIVDKSRMIQSWTRYSNEDFHTTFYKENIITATFLDSNAVPSNATESWDVSENKDGGVMAYVVESSTETGKYDLFIGANKGVIANVDSGDLFYGFTSLKSINFSDNFDTSNTTSMHSMFAYCSSLTDLNLNNFDTSNVSDMYALFFLCSSLISLDLRAFDTKNVTDMALMFEHCYNLKNVNLINFDTSNVINMSCMFHNCYKLELLNLCSFDTTNVRDMKWMFQHTDIIKNIYAGGKWSTTLAQNTTSVVDGVTVNNIARMFDGSGVSSVTKGEC